ncbi:Histidine biosynthesis bifunctional protein hisB, partial [Rhizoclosmatium hyalinum]
MTKPQVYLLDYGAGNVRSLVNAVNKMGFEITPITQVEDFAKADKIIFPGVGSFGFGVNSLRSKGFEKPLLEYLASGKPFMGICVGMQCLFESSEESVGVPGLGLVKYGITKFSVDVGAGAKKSVPHMGWNAALTGAPSEYMNHDGDESRYYFVHSYAAIVPSNTFSATEKEHLLPGGWTCTLTTYHNETFISAIKRGNVFATQFHPEKSGS